MKESFSLIVARLVQDAELADMIYSMKNGYISRKEFIEDFCCRLKDINVLDCERS